MILINGTLLERDLNRHFKGPGLTANDYVTKEMQ